MSGQLKEVRERISSVINTQQITKAMKMVSAAKLKRAQDGIVQMRPYSQRLDAMLKNILSNLDGGADTSLGKEREVKKALVVVITSSKGLCGAFNSNVIKQSLSLKNSEKFSGANFSYLVIGKKANDVLSKTENIIENYSSIYDNLTYEESSKITEKIIEEFKKQNF